MPALILPRRFTQQPQGAVRLKSWVPPPAFFLIPTGSSGFYDVVSGTTFSATGGAVIACNYGIGYSSDQGVTVGLLSTESDVDIAPISILYQVDHQPQEGAEFARVTPTTLAAYRPASLTANSTGLVHSLGGGNAVTSDVMTTSAGMATVAARVTDLAGQRAFCNGDLKQDRNLVTYWSGTTGGSVYRSMYSTPMPLLMFAFWPSTDIGDTLCEQASQDPLSFFEGPNRVLYFDVPTHYNIPTLSAAKATSITATSAVPQVTLTF